MLCHPIIFSGIGGILKVDPLSVGSAQISQQLIACVQC